MGSTGATGAVGTITQVTTTFTANAYTAQLSDANTLQDANNAAAATVTIPPHSSVAFPNQTSMVWNQQGAGKISFEEGAGVTIAASTSSGGFVNGVTGTRQIYSSVTLYQMFTDYWIMGGDAA